MQSYILGDQSIRTLSFLSQMYIESGESDHWTDPETPIFLTLTPREALLVELGMHAIVALPFMGVDEAVVAFLDKLKEIAMVQLNYDAGDIERSSEAINDFLKTGDPTKLRELTDELTDEDLDS